MKSLKYAYILIVIVLIGGLFQIIYTEESLNEKDRIITNLKNENTLPQEVVRIKEIRNNQITALTSVIADFQNGFTEKRASLRAVPAEAATKLLGELHAFEALDFLIKFSCFIIEEEASITALVSTDNVLAFDALKSATQKSLISIGRPAVPLLINLLKIKTSNSFQNELMGKFVRKTIYLIEDDCAIHRLEKALNEETDKKKKENLSEAITKFKEEIKAGVYNK